MYVSDDVQVRDVMRGSILDCVNGELPFQGVVQSNRHSSQECWSLSTEAGHRLVVSKSTPFTLRDGSSLYSYEMDGQEVLTDSGSGTPVAWQKCRAEYVGVREVGVITMGGLTFAAGETPDKRIYSHNYIKFPG
jgi:hypothetical protein